VNQNPNAVKTGVRPRRHPDGETVAMSSRRLVGTDARNCHLATEYRAHHLVGMKTASVQQVPQRWTEILEWVRRVSSSRLIGDETFTPRHPAEASTNTANVKLGLLQTGLVALRRERLLDRSSQSGSGLRVEAGGRCRHRTGRGGLGQTRPGSAIAQSPGGVFGEGYPSGAGAEEVFFEGLAGELAFPGCRLPSV